MNKKELQKWIKEVNVVRSQTRGYDECGNYEADVIYEKDGAYYEVSFFNDSPVPDFDENGSTDEYTPRRVTPVEKQVTVTEWVPVSP